MIRLVTSRRLRALSAQCEQAQTRAQQVQGKADQAYSGYIRKLYDLTARAEEAESDAAIIREEAEQLTAAVDNATVELDAARAELAARADRIAVLGKELEAARLEGRSVVLLLREGVPHSVHASVQAAKDHAAVQGADLSGWRPQADPSAVSGWLIMPVRRDGGGS